MQDFGTGAAASGVQAVSDWEAVDALASAQPVVSGRVKWFDAVRGYGFLVPDDGGADILVHYNLLSAHGRKSLPEGARLTAEVCEGQRGRAARSILSLDLTVATVPDAERLNRCSERLDPIDFLDQAGDFVPVLVRWFNRSKGYGFLLSEDGVTEVFIHMETVRRGGFDMLEPGQQLFARVSQGPRGALAVVLQPPPQLHA